VRVKALEPLLSHLAAVKQFEASAPSVVAGQAHVKAMQAFDAKPKESASLGDAEAIVTQFGQQSKLSATDREAHLKLLDKVSDALTEVARDTTVPSAIPPKAISKVFTEFAAYKAQFEATVVPSHAKIAKIIADLIATLDESAKMNAIVEDADGQFNELFLNTKFYVEDRRARQPDPEYAALRAHYDAQLAALHADAKQKVAASQSAKERDRLADEIKEARKKVRAKERELEDLRDDGELVAGSPSEQKRLDEINAARAALADLLRRDDEAARIAAGGNPALAVPASGPLELSRRKLDSAYTYEPLAAGVLKGSLHGSDGKVVLKVTQVPPDAVLTQQLELLGRLKHPNLAAVGAAFVDGPHLYVELPFYEHGNLEQWLTASKPDVAGDPARHVQRAVGARLHARPRLGARRRAAGGDSDRRQRPRRAELVLGQAERRAQRRRLRGARAGVGQRQGADRRRRRLLVRPAAGARVWHVAGAQVAERAGVDPEGEGQAPRVAVGGGARRGAAQALAGAQAAQSRVLCAAVCQRRGAAHHQQGPARRALGAGAARPQAQAARRRRDRGGARAAARQRRCSPRPAGAALPLPTDDAAALAKCEQVGKALLHAALRQRPTTARVAPTLLKHLIGVQPTSVRDLLRDMDAFDAARARHYRHVRQIDDVCQLDLKMADGSAVTNTNREAYLQQALGRELIDSRLAALDKVRAGFFSLSGVKDEVAKLKPSEVAVVIAGDEYLSGELVLARTVFEPSTANVDAFQQSVRSLASDDLRRLLYAVTGVATITPTTAITVVVAGESASKFAVSFLPLFSRIDFAVGTAGTVEEALGEALTAIDAPLN
jgi:hypothetical protein